MGSLCALLIALCVLALVLIGARTVWLWAFADDPAPIRRGESAGACRNCGRLCTPEDDVCPGCGLIAANANEVADLLITERQLRALRRDGVLDTDTFDRLRHHIVRLRGRIVRQEEPASQPVVVPRPSAPAEPVLEVLPVEAPPPIPVAVQVVVSAPEPVAVADPGPEPPRRTVVGWLAAFMEERHILWGELVGGLLMVGCSIALVLSLWQTLERIPLYPFVFLTTLTAALFGVGRYTLHRWKLEATSRGLLVIALLLVPLIFLVLAGLSRWTENLFEVSIRIVGLGILALLIPRAARDLFPPGDGRTGWRAAVTDGRLIAVAVQGISLAPLLAGRTLALGAESAVPLLLLAVWPVACHGVVVAFALRLRWGEDLTARGALNLLGYLGLTTFPLILVFGFTAVAFQGRFGELSRLMESLAPYAAVAAVPVIAVGLFVHRNAPREPILPVLLGTGVALVGGLAQTAALTAAWPNPTVVLLVALIGAVAWTAAAVGFRLPLAHAIAIPNLVAAALAVFHLTRTDLLHLNWRYLLSGETGTFLAAVAMVLALAADRLRSRDRWDHGVFHATGAGVVAIISIGLVSVTAVDVPLRAATVGLVFVVAGLVLGRRWRMPGLTHAATCLIPFTTMAALHGIIPEERTWWGAVLAAEALALSLIPGVWLPAVALTAALTPVGALLGPQPPSAPGHTATLTLLAATAIVQAVRLRETSLAWAGSLLLLVACGQAILTRIDAVTCALASSVFLTHAALLTPFLFTPSVRRLEAVSSTLADSAKLSSLAAGVCVAAGLFGTDWRSLTLAAAGLAGLWVVYLWRERRPAWFTAVQAAVTLAVVFAVAAWRAPALPLATGVLRHFATFGLALTATCIGWTILRLLVRPAAWLDAAWPAVERVLLAVVLTGTVAMATVNILPGVLAEMLPALPGGFTLTSHRHLLDGWWLLAALALALLLGLREARTAFRQTVVLVGLACVVVTIPVLAARAWEDQRATASALRWGMALAFVVGSLPFWGRRWLVRAARRVGVSVDETADEPRVYSLGVLLVVAAGIPLTLTIFTLSQLIAGERPLGPGELSYFRQIGFTWSHGVPLTLVSAALVGHALRERSPGFAFSAGLIAKLLVVGGFAVAVVTTGRQFDGLVWVELGQRATVTAAVWALGWVLVAKLMGRFRDADSADVHLRPSPLWNVQLALATAGTLFVLGVAVLAVVLPSALTTEYRYPVPAAWVARSGAWLGWAALGSTVVAAGLREWFAGSRRWPHVGGAAGLGVVALIACWLAPHGDGWGFRTLMLGWAACGLVYAVASGRDATWDGWAGVAVMLAVPLALKAAFGHGDLAPAALALALVGTTALRLAQLRRLDSWALGGGAAIHLAASFLVWRRFADQSVELWSAYLLQTNAVVGAAVAAVWLRLRARWTDSRWDPIPTIQLAVPVAFLVALAMPKLPELLLMPDRTPHPWLVQVGGWGGWLALLATAGVWWFHARRDAAQYVLSAVGLFAGVWAAGVAARWDSGNLLSYHTLAVVWAIVSLAFLASDRKRLGPSAAVFAGLVAVLAVRASVLGPDLLRTEAVALAGFVLLTQLVAARFRSSDEDEVFVVPQSLIGLTVVVLSIVVALTDVTVSARLAGALAVALLIPAAAFLARGARPQWTRDLSYATLTLGVLWFAEVGWAFVEPAARGVWLHRSAAVLGALAVATIGYSFGLARLLPRGGRWALSARQIGPVLGLVACGVIVLMIAQEGLLFDKVTRRTPLTMWETGLVAAAVVGLMVAAVAFAVKPWIDPFGLPERWRTAYVYGCEVLLVLLFLHVRFNVPGLFPKVDAQMWAFIIMGIAFVGVGLAELFQRLRLDVLAGPLRRTGVFLPVLPLLMFWLKPPAALRTWLGDLAPGTVPLMNFFDQIPTDFGTYSILWFLFGLLYGWVAVSRRSFRYALLAALAANVGLWALLSDQQVTFLLHPQLWLVPLALIVLVSEHIHHDRLRPELSVGLRYLGLGMLYLSSAADLFITGLGNSTVLPLVLALLSVLGVLVGILLRIKSYLFLGTGFLALVVFSMIWHAAVDRAQTWVWWACGIVLGAAILALFALFEKRRQKVLDVVDEIRAWR